MPDKPYDPVDYLVIGHITKDLFPGGYNFGGTASYASLTARAIGLKVGVVTAAPSDLPASLYHDIQIHSIPTEEPCTFENISTPEGRIQIIHHIGPALDSNAVPLAWRSAPIVHLGPVANEVDYDLFQLFASSFIGVTPQGWMRKWDAKGFVSLGKWQSAKDHLPKASAAVISIEDIQGDEGIVEQMHNACELLVVTEGAAGARLYWNGDLRYFKPPVMNEIDPTGAGDIFAASFFIRFHDTHDAWESARFATQLAARSVSRKGLKGIPTHSEVLQAQTEIIVDRSP
jgi:sugar/nucleoside kinase (ribokinase family)